MVKGASLYILAFDCFWLLAFDPQSTFGEHTLPQPAIMGQWLDAYIQSSVALSAAL